MSKRILKVSNFRNLQYTYSNTSWIEQSSRKTFKKSKCTQKTCPFCIKSESIEISQIEVKIECNTNDVGYGWVRVTCHERNIVKIGHWNLCDLISPYFAFRSWPVNISKFKYVLHGLFAPFRGFSDTQLNSNCP